MTVKHIAAHKLFIGASGDTKPTSVPVGSIFIESDTDAIYRTTDDGTTWVQIDVLAQLVAGTAVVGKVRLVTATGAELSNDALDTVVVSQASHDNLSANANMQVGNADVAAANAVPVTPGTAAIFPASIDQTTPGTTNLVESRPSARRDAGVLHRNAITSVDKVADLANTDLTTADNGAGTGSLNQGTTYYVTAIPRNRWGPSKVAGTINTQATAASGLNTHSVRLTIPQVTGSDGYSVFLSTDTAPKWVGYITEAQRAAGDYEITALGTVAAGGGNPAGTVDVNVAGTGIQSDNGVFAQSNSYRPATVTAINCAGRSKAHILVKLALTDLRSAPSLSVVPFVANQVSANDWHQGRLEPLSLLGGLGQSLEQDFVLDVDGSTGLVVLVDAIGGQGAAASVWVELS